MKTRKQGREREREREKLAEREQMGTTRDNYIKKNSETSMIINDTRNCIKQHRERD